MNYFDLHCDTISKCFHEQQSLLGNSLHLALDRIPDFRHWAQFFAVFVPDKIRGPAAWQYYLDIYHKLLSEVAASDGMLRLCKSAPELEATWAAGKRAAILSIEGSAALHGDLDLLPIVYGQGVRMITLTWNGRCEAGDGCLTEQAGGLTDFGRELVDAMENMPIMIDVSHLSDQGFAEVAARTAKPFVASHSNSRTLCDCRRNLTDDQFREICRRGGLVGINLYHNFLRSGEMADLSDILKHVEHFLNLGGEQVIALGGDLDGATLPAGIQGIEDFPTIYAHLVKAFGLSIADGIFFDNARHFFLAQLSR